MVRYVLHFERNLQEIRIDEKDIAKTFHIIYYKNGLELALQWNFYGFCHRTDDQTRMLTKNNIMGALAPMVSF